MSLQSHSLQAFMAVAETKTVHAAAGLLHLTQTAVTQRIRTLETRLKTTLFIRTRRGMMLTPEGEALLRYCFAAKELEGEALAKIQGAGLETAITMRITGATSIMTSRIIPQCLPVMKKFPHLLMHFDVNDLESRILTLKSGECQFAVIREEDIVPEMAFKALRPEKYVLVCTSAWKHRKLTDILTHERFIDYDPEDQMTFHYLKHFGLFELAKHERYFVNRTDSLAKMLVDGIGYGVLTKEFSQKYLESKQLTILNKQQSYENKVVLAWYPRHEPPHYFREIIDAIR
ncbi:MAG: LysR family transcriptional regulator [Gammaproteobacteria bacterium]|nr:LysR family transcriptional regulator [Gammaproteobacteria bacterium]